MTATKSYGEVSSKAQGRTDEKPGCRAGSRRARARQTRQSRSAPTVTELFAGAGLLGYSFKAEGFHLERAVEQDASAAASYSKQLGGHVEVADVRASVPHQHTDVLVAGPPCQGFSTLGTRNPNDPRNLLSLEVVRWAEACRPQVVVIENVGAFLDAPVWEALVSRFQGMGYETSAVILDAVRFGVAQRRVRSFTFASRVGQPQVEVPSAGVEPTVRSAWEGLPARPDGRNLHYAPAPSGIALSRMLVIPPGGSRRDVLERAPHLAAPSWWKLGSQATDCWGRMQWDEPANTLRTSFQNASKGRYIHPEENRVISLREAARLHSIDDGWTFEGSPHAIARQIGNSVPPLLGRAVARAVAAQLGFNGG